MDLPAVIKQVYAEQLLNLLKSIDGKKDLVIDKDLICALDLCVAGFSQLKEVGIEKVIKLEPGASPGAQTKCVYLVRPSVKVIKVIADHINANKCSEKLRSFWIIYVPRKLHICSFVLEREGVFGDVIQLEFPLGFLVIDKDIFSLELNDFYKSFYLKGDQTHLHTVAISLLQLFNLSGSSPNIYGQGKCSSMVIDLMRKLVDETVSKTSEHQTISDIIIVDRDIDYASMLLSQLTYEGLLDETIGINSGRILFPKQVTGKNDPIKVLLNCNNLVFEEIRNCHFTSVFGQLRERARQLQQQTETSNMTLGDIKEFVTKDIRNIQQQQGSLALHIGACEFIMEKKNSSNFPDQLRTENDIIEGRNGRGCLNFIEDIINKQESIFRAFRLLCLMSIVQDGISSKDYNLVITQLFQSYGHKHLVTVENLKTSGLLYDLGPIYNIPSNSGAVKATKIAEKVATAFSRGSTFRVAAKKLNLIPNEGDNVDVKNPVDPSYVFSGTYTPIACKIAEQIIMFDGLKNIEDGLKLLPGNTTNATTNSPKKQPPQKLENNKKTIVVFFLGGVTYAEVAALRLLSRLKGRDILVCCTSVINGNSLLKMLMPDNT